MADQALDQRRGRRTGGQAGEQAAQVVGGPLEHGREVAVLVPHPQAQRPGHVHELQQIVAHYQTIIGNLPEQPLIVGHSFGGLIAQLLLDRGLGVAGIALDPAPIAGVIPGPVSLMAAFGPILAGPSTAFTISRAAFGTTFANTVPGIEQPEIYDHFVVPTSTRIFYQAAFMLGTRVDARNRRQPLLITVGDKDRTVTPYVARAAYNLQKRASARTDFKEFAGRSHFLAGEKGWEDVAAFCIDWAKQVGA